MSSRRRVGGAFWTVLRIWGGVVAAILCAPIQVFGMALQRVLPDDGSLFLDSVIIARKPGRRSE